MRSIVLSAGRSCFVKCKGCYNCFGKHPDLTRTEVILEFLAMLPDGIKKITIGGGDPLSRPRIAELLAQIKALNFAIHLDTVGSPFLSDTRTVFFGRDLVEKIDVNDIYPHVDLIGIPIDGSTDHIATKFRAGRINFLAEQEAILALLDATPARVCINTVSSRHNIEDLPNIFKCMTNHKCIVEWQIFQFMPIGPLGFTNRLDFRIDDEVFKKAIDGLHRIIGTSHSADGTSYANGIRIVAKSRAMRKGRYLMIDTDGIAWHPICSSANKWQKNWDENRDRYVVGNINRPLDYERIVACIADR